MSNNGWDSVIGPVIGPLAPPATLSPEAAVMMWEPTADTFRRARAELGAVLGREGVGAEDINLGLEVLDRGLERAEVREAVAAEVERIVQSTAGGAGSVGRPRKDNHA